MTDTNDMREAFDLWSEQHGEEPIFPLQVWEAACQWQSQQAQGELYGYVYDGQLLCDEQDFADYFDGAQYDISTMTPVYIAPPAPAAVPEVIDVLRKIKAWDVDQYLALPHEIRAQIQGVLDAGLGA